MGVLREIAYLADSQKREKALLGCPEISLWRSGEWLKEP
jgi:hypothetical protein